MKRIILLCLLSVITVVGYSQNHPNRMLDGKRVTKDMIMKGYAKQLDAFIVKEGAKALTPKQIDKLVEIDLSVDKKSPFINAFGSSREMHVEIHSRANEMRKVLYKRELTKEQYAAAVKYFDKSIDLMKSSYQVPSGFERRNNKKREKEK